MKPDVLIFTDLHLDYSMERSTRLDRGLELFKHMLVTAAQNDMIVLFAGDLIDKTRGDVRVNVLAQQVLLDVYHSYPKLQCYFIAGNHDQSGKSSLHNLPVSAVDLWENTILMGKCKGRQLKSDSTGVDRVLVKTSQGTKLLIAGIQFYTFPEDLDKVLDQLAELEDDEADAKVLMLHQSPAELGEIFDAHLNASDKRLSFFDMVFCGHIHQHTMVTENFMLVGPPMETRADEAGMLCGYVLYDSKLGRYVHVSTEGMYPSYAASAETAEPGYYRPKSYEDVTDNVAFTAYTGKQPIELVSQYLEDTSQDDYLNKQAIKTAKRLLAL